MRVPPADVVSAAQDAHAKYEIPASISLAQWALESAWGSKCTGRFNFFGIKAPPTTPGTNCWTHEERDGRLVACQQRFRDFADLEQAFDYHAFLISTGKPYEAAMQALRKGDLAAFIHLMAPHYATDPAYANKLEQLRTDEQFARFDK